MLVETPQARSKIRRIVERMDYPSGLREDMVQEAAIHLWLSEARCPGMPLPWHCKGCCFHVRHLAKRGRSVDSPKRAHLGSPLADLAAQADLGTDEVVANSRTPLEDCCAQDNLEQLRSRLDRLCQRVLELLLQDYGVREIAVIVGLSPAAVVKRRARIASVARSLGIGPTA